MIGLIKKEFILEVNLDSDYPILDNYIEGLENKGYTILRSNSPIMMDNDQTYSMKSYKNVYDNTKMIASFMVGKRLSQKRLIQNRTEETVHSILYGLFANIENMLSKNNTNVGVI
jgi:hypothetical protein